MSDRIQLASEKLSSFFIFHLNRIYAAKAHLVKRLPELQHLAGLRDLAHAITETAEDVERQIARMALIYELLDQPVSPASLSSMEGLMKDTFAAIKEQQHDPQLCDLSILFYLQNIENVELSSFKMLQMAAVKLPNAQIRQLLRENYDEAKADRTLFLLISAKYIAG